MYIHVLTCKTSPSDRHVYIYISEVHVHVWAFFTPQGMALSLSDVHVHTIAYKVIAYQVLEVAQEHVQHCMNDSIPYTCTCTLVSLKLTALGNFSKREDLATP